VIRTSLSSTVRGLGRPTDHEGSSIVRVILSILITLVTLMIAALAWLTLRFRRNRRRSDEAWVSLKPQTLDIGQVRRLRVTPLVEWRTANEQLTGEAGVSYLVEADGTTLLFDVGLNGRREHPSPLLRNAAALGVELSRLDAVVISHLHTDHVGGMSHQRSRTFALSAEPVDLSGVTAYVPEPMSHPTAQIEVVEEPCVIFPGVASIGPIPAALFFLGWTPEQALAVNVTGKGIVLIVGCGHQGVRRIVERAEALFSDPMHGLVGGLHFPVTASREVRLGLPLQRFLGTGRPPWSPLGKEDVQAAIAYLQRWRLNLLALSAHDSCDWSLSAFREAFGSSFQEVAVGRAIVVEEEG